MLFNYGAITKEGEKKAGSIDSFSVDTAISSLQRRGFVVTSIEPAEESDFIQKNFPFLQKVSQRDIVILSRQVSTLFEAKVPALQVFRLLASESESPILRTKLTEVTDDIQSGVTISQAMSKHSVIFSDFYVNMVKAGEESGKLSDTFSYLADYLERAYELSGKAKNALVYPAFVVATFIIVMTLMFVMVIPKLGEILVETGQEIPLFTKIILGLSHFFLNYGVLLLALIIVGLFMLWRFSQTQAGQVSLSKLKLSTPYIGRLYRKFYLSRIADNMETMLSSGIPIIRALEVTKAVVGNRIYEDILDEAVSAVQSGSSVSESLDNYDEIPRIMVQMVKVGEETGKLGFVLKTMARFYKGEVDNEVNNLVSLIEPALIVVLAAGVGVLLSAVLIPIYNTTAGI